MCEFGILLHACNYAHAILDNIYSMSICEHRLFYRFGHIILLLLKYESGENYDCVPKFIASVENL